MTTVNKLTRLNLLAVWNKSVRVWGSEIRAVSLDRLLYLYLHRARFMGRNEKTFLEQRVRPGMRVLDIGANVGLYSLLLSRLVGKGGSVIAIEPDPDLFAALESSCRTNAADNIELHKVAAAAESGRLSLYRSLLNAGDNRIGSHDRADTTRRVEARAATVDELVGGRPVDFIKMDVQGWEGQVLKGMRAVMESNPAIEILFEFWPFGLREAGCDPQDLLSEFERFGLRVHTLNEADKQVGGPSSPLYPSGKNYMNLLATGRKSAEFQRSGAS
jgi:FkbM family methyltransferase